MSVEIEYIDNLWKVNYKGIRYYIAPDILKEALYAVNKSFYGINNNNLKTKLKEFGLSYSEFYEGISRFRVKIRKD